MSDTAPPAIRLPAALARELHVIDARHFTRAAIFLALYAAAIAAVLALAGLDTPWRWLAAAPFYLLAAACLHGLSLFTHEAVHGTLARNPTLNAILGAACAMPVLQNFSAYRVLHLRHHDHLGEEGDPTTTRITPAGAGWSSS